MLPFVLVSLLVSSALAVPVSVTTYNVNEVAPQVDNGSPINGFAITGAFESIIDGGETNIYITYAQNVLNDLANQPDRLSQSLAAAQAIGILGELAYGVAGDSCQAAALVNAYADRVRTGNTAGLRAALNSYLRRLTDNIDVIVRLANDPDSVRYSVGPKGNCAGGGRRYNLEAAWDAILNNVGPYQIGLVNEQSCATRRLYAALDNRSNNVGAALTATAVPAVREAFNQSLGPVSTFLKTVASGGNPAGAAGAAKQALIAAGGRVPL